MGHRDEENFRGGTYRYVEMKGPLGAVCVPFHKQDKLAETGSLCPFCFFFSPPYGSRKGQKGEKHMKTGKKTWLALGILVMLGGVGVQAAEPINGGNAVSAHEDITDKVVEISSGIYDGAAIRGGNVDGGSEIYHGKVENNMVKITGGTFTGANVVVGGRNKGDGNTIGNSISVSNLSEGYFECFDGGMAKSGDSLGNSFYLVGSDIKVNSYINGGSSETGSVVGNQVALENSQISINYIRGGYEGAGTDSTTFVKENTISLKNVTGTVNNAVTGGYATGIESTQNKVSIEGSTLEGKSHVSGGWSQNASANANEVTITSGSTVQNVYGGLASTAGRAGANTVTIDQSVARDVYGGQSGSGAVNDNTVSIANGSTIWGSIYGGKSGESGSVSGNVVKIDNSATKHYVYGGYGVNGTVSKNTVELKNGSTAVSPVYGGFTYGDGDVTGNSVTIAKSTTVDVYGGLSSGKGDVTGNTIILDGATVAGVVRGGDSANGDVTGNAIYIKNGGDLSQARLKGGKSGSSGAKVENNKIVIEDGGHWKNTLTVGDIGELNNGSLEFEKLSLNGESFVVKSTNASGSYVGKTTIKINSLDVSEADLASGDDFNKILKFEGINFTNTGATTQQVDVEDVKKQAEKELIGVQQGADGTQIGIRVYTLKDISETHTSFWGNTDNDRTVTISGKVDQSILTGQYTDGAGSVTGNGTLQLGDLGIASTKQNIIAGAYAASGDAAGGHVVIDSGFMSNSAQTVYGGYSAGGKATGNTVTLLSVNNGNLNLVGGHGTEVSANTLQVDGQNTVGNVSGFDTVAFSNVSVKDGDVALKVGSLSDVKGYVVNSFATGQTLANGQTVTLVDGTVQDKADTTKQTFTQGAGLVFDGTVGTDGNGNIVLTVGNGKASAKASDAASSHGTAVHFLADGSQLVLTGISSIASDDASGIQTFAATERSDSSYDGGADIDGWKMIAGVGAKNQLSGGALSWGIFAERGLGSYTTRVEQGAGDVEYNGGGAALRYTKASGLYGEASLRLGKLHDDVDGVLGGSYDTSADYKAYHVGVGKLFHGAKGTLDVYGKYFYTKADGTSFTVDQQTYDMDGVESQRFRLGARYSQAAGTNLGFYYGAAWEYEFDGDADGRVEGYALDTAGFGGSTFLGEVGLTYKPAGSRWDFEVGITGYTGERDGISGTIRGAYHF